MNKKQIEQRKKTFFTRTRSAIFVIAFYVLFFLFLYFSNEKWFPPLLSLDVRTMLNVQFVLNLFNVLMVVPIIVFVSKEITNLCFPTHKAVFYYTVSALFILTMGVSIFLLGMRYKFFTFNVDSQFNNFTLFLIASLSGIVFFTLVSTLVWVIMSRHITYVGKKTRFWYPFLIFVLNTFFVGFIYTSIIHSWTTFAFLILISTGCDVFAYVGGTHFGKNKLAPNISPKKTWEGLAFGVGLTLAMMCIIYALFYAIPGAERLDHTLYRFLGCQSCPVYVAGEPINLKPYFWAIYIIATLTIMIVSILGDLFFSFIKRRFNIKDFSNLLPGHGGILDRLDALIFTFTFYFFFTIVIQLIMLLAFNKPDGLLYLWGDVEPNFVF
ncbi:MAG: phosphatidate cytidylyltransferase [Mycoplasma sp.]|nr:phosphatidate cytidylyltransferase [Candidatus Hennigella equi]